MAESSDGREMLIERSRYRAGDQKSKILNLRSSENTLLQVDGEARRWQRLRTWRR